MAKAKEEARQTVQEVVLHKNDIEQLTVGLPTDRAKQIKDTFVPIVNLLESMEDDYNRILSETETDPYTPVLAKSARELRLKYVKVRTSADAAHKKVKEDLILQTRAIDGMRNIIKYASTDKEEKLAHIENYIENQRKIEIAHRQEERQSALSDFGTTHFPPNLGEMEEDAWEIYYMGARQVFIQKKEAEEKAERLRRRKDAILPYSPFIDNFDSYNLQEMSDKDFDAILEEGRSVRERHMQEQAKIQEEKRKLEQERAEAAKKEAEERERLLNEERERNRALMRLTMERVSALTDASNDGVTVTYKGKKVCAVTKLQSMSDSEYAEMREKHILQVEEDRRKEAELEAAKEAEMAEIKRQKEQAEREMAAIKEKMQRPMIPVSTTSTGDTEKLLELCNGFRNFAMPEMNTAKGKELARRIKNYMLSLADKLEPEVRGMQEDVF